MYHDGPSQPEIYIALNTIMLQHEIHPLLYLVIYTRIEIVVVLFTHPEGQIPHL